MESNHPGPAMKHCPRCNLDYLAGLQHTTEECLNRLDEKKWPPTGIETKTDNE